MESIRVDIAVRELEWLESATFAGRTVRIVLAPGVIPRANAV